MRILSGCLFSARSKYSATRYTGHRHSRHVSRSTEGQKWVPTSRHGTSLLLGKKVSLRLFSVERASIVNYAAKNRQRNGQTSNIYRNTTCRVRDNVLSTFPIPPGQKVNETVTFDRIDLHQIVKLCQWIAIRREISPSFDSIFVITVISQRTETVQSYDTHTRARCERKRQLAPGARSPE